MVPFDQLFIGFGAGWRFGIVWGIRRQTALRETPSDSAIARSDIPESRNVLIDHDLSILS